jgi:flagellar hook assembly protein FlgD
LTILDVNGRVIRILNDDDQLSVDHTIYWDGRDNSGKNVNSGVYFYRLEGSGFSLMKRMVKM